MMEANIEDNEFDQYEVAAAEQEQEQQQVIIAAATKRRHLQIDSVLERKDKFPLRNRKKIDLLIKDFLEKLGDDIHDMLCDNFTEMDTYDGLDSDRDTEEELETAIRFFPEVVSRRKARYEGANLHYPIQLLALARVEDGNWQCNVKAVAFVPLLARLAIEHGLFEEDERGGLLCHDIEDEITRPYTLTYLMLSAYTKLPSQEHHKSVDTKYLQVLIQLRKFGLLNKEDIQRHRLLHILCCEDHFAEKRFRFVVEWDPNALTQTDKDGWLPIYCQACLFHIQTFHLAFEDVIRYFPKKKGISLLFRKTNDGRTTFQKACIHCGYEKVMKVVEDTLAWYSGTPVNVPETLLLAAIDENVHLDCVYFLLRREPDLLLKLLPQLLPSSSSSASASASGSPNDNDDDNNSRNSSKKRKRKTTTTTSSSITVISGITTIYSDDGDTHFV